MLLKVWFSYVVVLLLAALSVALYYFDISNVLDWAIIVVLLVALLLTALVYLEQPHKKGYKKLQKTYADFLLQKDKQIDELRGKNNIMFKTALKRSEDNLKVSELKKKLEEHE